MAETWVLNSTISMPSEQFYINFTSDGQSFARIVYGSPGLMYSNSATDAIVYKASSWTNEAYRTIVFDTAPSGDLLTWLQANGTKQSEPEAETQKHVCLIDGTGYSVLRGKALIGSTGYDIISGRALVSGTGYDIAFTPKAYVVTVTLSGYTYVIYNDTLYSYDTVLYVTPGDSVRCVVNAPLRDGRTEVAVRVNGTEVETSSFQGPPPYSLPQYSYYYDFTPESDATITGMVGGTNNKQHGEIDVAA